MENERIMKQIDFILSRRIIQGMILGAILGAVGGVIMVAVILMFA